MAGTPIGTIFAELDLDTTKFSRSQKEILSGAKTTALDVEKNWRIIGEKSDVMYNAMKANIANAYDMIKNKAGTSAAEITRAHEAMTAKIADLNRQQFGENNTLLDKFKSNWVAASAVVVGAIASIHKAHELMREGAKALQIESSFKILAEEAGADSEKMIDAMKKGTRGAVEASDLMQKANKAMLAGYDPEQIVKFSEVVIAASQYMGTNVTEAYEKIIDSLATRMPKAMVAAGAIIADQKTLVKDAMAAGATQSDLMALAIANLALKTEQLKGTQDEAIISMQRHEAQMKEMKETVGRGLIIVFTAFMGVLDFVASGFFAVVYGMQKFNEASANVKAFVAEMVPGFEAYAKQQREIARAYGESAAAAKKNMEELDKAGRQKVGLGDPEKEKLASAESLKAARERVKAEESKMKAIIAAGKASEESSRQAEQAEKSIAEAIRRANYEKETVNSTQEVKDLARIASEAEKYAQLGASKVSVEKFVAAEKALIAEKASKLAYDVQSAAAMKEADASIEQMKREIEEGMKGGEIYRKMKAEEYDFAATENERQINAIIAKEEEKLRILAELRAKDLVSIEDYTNLKIQIETNATKAIIEKNTENALKVAKGNLDLIKGIRGMEGQAYQDRIAEIQAQAAVYEKEGLDRGRIALWVADQEKKAWMDSALAFGSFSDGVRVGLQNIVDSQTTWGQAAAELTKKTFGHMEEAASTLFFDVVTGNLDDLGKVFENLWKSILKDFIDMIAKMVIEWLALQALMAMGINVSIAGGVGGGSGGSIGSSIAGTAISKGAGAAWNYAFGGGTAAAAGAGAGSTTVGIGAGGAVAAYGADVAGLSGVGAGGAAFGAGEFGVGAGAAGAGGAGGAGTAGMIATVAPYALPIIGAGLAMYSAWQSMHRDLVEPALRQLKGSSSNLLALSGQRPEMAGDQMGREVTALMGTWTDKEKTAYIVEQIKNMKDYREDAKLTEEQLDKLIAQSLGPLDKSLGVSAKATMEAGEAMRRAGSTDKAYRDIITDLTGKMKESVDPVKFLTDAISLNSNVGQDATQSIQFLSDVMGMSSEQAARLTEEFTATGQSTEDINKEIDDLAKALGISSDQALDLAKALNLIPKDININFSKTVAGEATAPMVEPFASGGMVYGGSGARDDLLIAVTGGEFVVNPKATAKHRRLLSMLNAGVPGFAEGGPVTYDEWWAKRIELFNAAGDTENAKKYTRMTQLETTKPELVDFQKEIYAWEDRAEAQAKHEEQSQKQAEAADAYYNKELELMKATGHEREAEIRQREHELAYMPQALKGMQLQIWAAEDLKKANDELTKSQEAAAAEAKKISDQRHKMEITLLKAQGKADEALAIERQDALDALDPSLRALQKQIDAETDLAQVRDKAASTLQSALDKIKAEDYSTRYAWQKAIAMTKIRGFDSGGYHPGGPLVVGESGPELMFTGPGRIFSNQASKNLLGTGELVAEVRALRTELTQLGIQQTNNTRTTAKIIEKWDYDGQPSVRDSDAVTWG
jgi:hypothetical protein